MAAKVFFWTLALLSAVSAAPEARESRITGGTPITIQEAPFTASVVYFYPRPQVYIQRCVGAVISSWHVLTTAFCFTGAVLSNMHVHAGSTNSLSGGRLVSVRDVIRHPDYVATPVQNDVAVMFLASPLPISSTINTLLLPPPGFVIRDDATFKIVSWGFESETGAQLQTLRSIFLDNVRLDVCSAAYAGISNVAIRNTMLCAARSGNVGTCRGDSGAPMVLNNVLVGIASIYHECGTNVFPDVFTRVDRFTNWIMEVAQPPRDGGVPVRMATVN